MRKSLLQVALAAVLVAAGAVVVTPQVTIPNTFTSGTIADPAAVNANFTQLGSQALNRTGGTMTGTLSSQAITPATDATYALGTGLLRYTTGSFSGTVTANAFAGDGSALTGLDAGDISAGTLPIARGGTNATATPTAGGVIYGTGSAYAVTSAGSSGQALVSNGASAPSFQTITTVPSGLVAFSTSGSCPSGWSEYTTARGRYIVGLVSGGTNQGTAGTALSNTENRAVGQHTHTQDAHSHTATDSGHTHSYGTLASGGAGSDYPAGATAGSFQSQTTGSGTANISVANTTATNQNAGSVAGTNAPYVQLIACSKD